MVEYDRPLDTGQVWLRASMTWTTKTALATAGCGLIGLMGVAIIAVGVTTSDPWGLVLGVALATLIFCLVGVMTVQRSRQAPVLEVGDFGVRAYSNLPRTEQVWQLTWDEVAFLGAFEAKTGTLVKSRYLTFVATEEARGRHRRPKRSPRYPELWFSVIDDGWTVSIEDVVQCARHFRPDLLFDDTRGT